MWADQIQRAKMISLLSVIRLEQSDAMQASVNCKEGIMDTSEAKNAPCCENKQLSSGINKEPQARSLAVEETAPLINGAGEIHRISIKQIRPPKWFSCSIVHAVMGTAEWGRHKQ